MTPYVRFCIRFAYYALGGKRVGRRLSELIANTMQAWRTRSPRFMLSGTSPTSVRLAGPRYAKRDDGLIVNESGPAAEELANDPRFPRS